MNVACICGHHKDDHVLGPVMSPCLVDDCGCMDYEAEEFIG